MDLSKAIKKNGRTKACYNCGKEGHFANKCDKPRRAYNPAPERTIKASYALGMVEDLKEAPSNDEAEDPSAPRAPVISATEQEARTPQDVEEMDSSNQSNNAPDDDVEPLVLAYANEEVYDSPDQCEVDYENDTSETEQQGDSDWSDDQEERGTKVRHFHGVYVDNTRDVQHCLSQPDRPRVKGDHKWVDITHNSHWKILWIYCVHDACIDHLSQKVKHECFPCRNNNEPIPAVDMGGRGMEEWIVHPRGGTYYELEETEYHPEECIFDTRSSWDCPHPECRKHYESKIALNIGRRTPEPLGQTRGTELLTELSQLLEDVACSPTAREYLQSMRQAWDEQVAFVSEHALATTLDRKEFLEVTKIIQLEINEDPDGDKTKRRKAIWETIEDLHMDGNLDISRNHRLDRETGYQQGTYQQRKFSQYATDVYENLDRIFENHTEAYTMKESMGIEDLVQYLFRKKYLQPHLSTADLIGQEISDQIQNQHRKTSTEIIREALNLQIKQLYDSGTLAVGKYTGQGKGPRRT
ncbi:hypothetical protein Micbo1qcDRAFT_210568 [Microdochium bolleyi]|uniref:CCHC-type domain-containing protein n=1 Tax=Microdochium bolleyi TaxID=196109 RepID=A0A136IHY9_9PEZI|nr:hypothetical protein Micbo1qcDRAFT_210568 [Microdochium bolleyi]